MDELTKAIVEQSEGVLQETYKDIVSPSAKPVGIMLSLLPRTIRLGLSKWEKWVINGEESLRLTAQALKEKVDKIPEEKQCEPEPYIAVPAIQQISYCYDSEELRELYANLLASSMNTEKKTTVHPSFVDIIKQLTPDEAKILSRMPRTSVQNLPLIDVAIKVKDGGEHACARNIISPTFYDLCEHPESMSGYIENLKRLQLIDIPSHQSLTDVTLYNVILESEMVKTLKRTTVLPESMEWKINKKTFNVTDFGVDFIQCCVDE